MPRLATLTLNLSRPLSNPPLGQREEYAAISCLEAI